MQMQSYDLCRFESAPDVERGNSNNEEPDVTEELTLLGVNETKSQPQTSSGVSFHYCKSKNCTVTLEQNNIAIQARNYEVNTFALEKSSL